MLEKIKQILDDSGVYGWEINNVKKNGWEFYFIRHELDQHRESGQSASAFPAPEQCGSSQSMQRLVR